MKKFFSEFKTFINRGNVVDLAVGVMVGSAFTAMVNGLGNFILKPLINYLVATLLGGESLSDIHTYLLRVYDETGELDLSQSIYIDWSSFISAAINFMIIAFVLFCVVKLVNKFREEHKEFTEMMVKNSLSRKEKRALRAQGIDPRDSEAVARYKEKKREEELAAKEAAKREAEEKARLEREKNPTAEDLLKEILSEMRKEK